MKTQTHIIFSACESPLGLFLGESVFSLTGLPGDGGFELEKKICLPRKSETVRLNSWLETRAGALDYQWIIWEYLDGIGSFEKIVH